MATATKNGFVLHSNGQIFIQKADDSRFGFSLHDDDQSWEGGIGLGNGTWELLDDTDPRITDEIRERLGWILED